MLRKCLFFSIVILFGSSSEIGWGQEKSPFPLKSSPPSIPELRIYSHDSFLGEGGLGPAIFSAFEKKEGCRIKAVSVGDGVQILTRLQLDSRRGKQGAHLVVGIDQIVWEQAKAYLEKWGTWTPKGYSTLRKDVLLEKGFLPFDFGVLAFMMDRNQLKEIPELVGTSSISSLSDLLQSKWARRFILEDPRTSTPGLLFLLFSEAVLKDQVWKFWRDLKTQWLTLTPGWEAAYQLFIKREAPLVWSYVTSQAYHEEKGDSQGSARRYQALVFPGGNPFQIEGAALVKESFASSKERELAKKFLEYLISKEVQARVPRSSWMYPVRKNVDLPKSFVRLPQSSKKAVSSDATQVNSILSKWNSVIF